MRIFFTVAIVVVLAGCAEDAGVCFTAATPQAQDDLGCECPAEDDCETMFSLVCPGRVSDDEWWLWSCELRYSDGEIVGGLELDIGEVNAYEYACCFSGSVIGTPGERE